MLIGFNSSVDREFSLFMNYCQYFFSVNRSRHSGHKTFSAPYKTILKVLMAYAHIITDLYANAQPTTFLTTGDDTVILCIYALIMRFLRIM